MLFSHFAPEFFVCATFLKSRQQLSIHRILEPLFAF